MNGKTVICAYGKNEAVERVFERLYGIYLTNFDKDFRYCALIDLPDAISYRASGDRRLEENAQSLTRKLNRESGNAFFCAIRQRRFAGSMECRKYACEAGAKGALEALWRYCKGKSAVLFPIFGKADVSEVSRIYFSGSENSEGDLCIIEPGGVHSLCARLGEKDAVFAFAGDMEGQFCSKNERVFEGLYGEKGLDKLMFSAHVELNSQMQKNETLVKYREKSLFALGKDAALL